MNSLEGDGKLIAIIGDEDTVTGFLLTGVGNVDAARKQNFLVVTGKTTQGQIEDAFKGFTKNPDVAVILINQNIANEIRHVMNEFNETIPAILEIPSKDHPYDASKDPIMDRVNTMLGHNN